MEKRPGLTTYAKDGSGASEQEEVGRLVAAARARGEGDVFAGKRRWLRYRLGIRLELTLGAPDSSEVRQVVMHDISAGGCGFWSNESLPERTEVLIREWSAQGDTTWLRAVVTHCTLGIAGHRIGVAFCDPLPPDSRDAGSQASRQPTGHSGRVVGARGGRQGHLWVKCMAASAAASGLAALAGAATCVYFWPNVPWIWVAVSAPALTAGLAGLLVLVHLKAHLRFLRSMLAGIQALGRGPADPEPPTAAPSRELEQFQQAFAELQLVWRKQRQQDDRSRQKLEELNFLKTNILNMVSHDLRTPLTSILLYAKMLEDELTELAVDDQRRFLKIISDECTRLSHLVDDLLEAQRLEANRVQWKMEPLDLTKAIRACGAAFRAMAESKSIDFTVDCPDALPPVTADADKIAQVLSNLVSNALKYTQAGGRVQLSGRPDGNGVLICASDNGPGIPRDQWDQIFDRFAQVPASYVRLLPGVGLGLNIVRQIVDRHGGRVWVDSEVGRGSDFYVALPAKASTTSSDPVEVIPTTSTRVLVCDPDPELADKIRHVLRAEGFDVRVAHSGCRLLALLEQGHTDVVMTDILLPDMNAADLLYTINDRRQGTFALIVHSYAGEGHDLRQRGVDIFLGRPARGEDIVQAVKLASRKQRGTGLTVLVVAPRSTSDALQSPLLDAGHTPISANTTADAIERLRSYPADVVVVANDALAADWSDLPALQQSIDERARVVVMCKRVGRSERKGAERYGVEVVRYEAGRESDVLAAIPGLRPAKLQEVVT